MKLMLLWESYGGAVIIYLFYIPALLCQNHCTGGMKVF